MSDAPPPQSTRMAILIPFFIVTFIWGSTWLVIVDQIAVVPPSWSVAYRFLVAGVAMLVVAALRGNSLRLDARGIAFAAMFGIPQFALNFNFVYRAEQHVTSGLVAVVFALLLVPNALFARIFLGQKLGRQLLLGSCVAMIGVAMLFLHEARRDPAASGEVLIGVGLTLLGILSASIANVLQATKTAKAYPLPTLLAWAMLMGAAVDAAFAFAIAGPPTVEWRVGYFLGIAYLGIAASAIAFSLYFRLIQVIGPAKAAYSSVLIPVIAMLLSTLFEGYRWSLLAASGAVLVIAGLILALRARRPNR
ncbi:DMT family transporter [Sphingosinithalassobacter portus]|uniref:DMT family transporter n=1 Tax=Stakelama portus TaxID=2676234 RepID=UPI000D6E20BB|nr:EamA family transporter [Sphingosinithalassobacter portus]